MKSIFTSQMEESDDLIENPAFTLDLLNKN